MTKRNAAIHATRPLALKVFFRHVEMGFIPKRVPTLFWNSPHYFLPSNSKRAQLRFRYWPSVRQTITRSNGLPQDFYAEHSSSNPLLNNFKNFLAHLLIIYAAASVSLGRAYVDHR